MTGWVRVSRSIFEHDLFAHEPMSEREAWLWLVAKAAWKDTQHRVGGVVHDVPRGTLFATLRELQSAWKWGSDGRVRRFLDLLENQRMIQRSGDAGKTRIAICNYSKFQDGERTDDAAMTVCTTQPRRTDDALKEEDNKITKDTATLPSAPASDLNGLEVKCRQAANAEQNPSPSLFDLSPVMRCLTAGASLELDVLPVIRQITVRGHRWSSWKYAEQAIMDAKANREAPAKPGIAQPRGQPPPGKVSNNRRILDALNTTETTDAEFTTSHAGPVQISTTRPVFDVLDGGQRRTV
jgi:hypothetical protein